MKETLGIKEKGKIRRNDNEDRNRDEMSLHIMWKKLRIKETKRIEQNLERNIKLKKYGINFKRIEGRKKKIEK